MSAEKASQVHPIIAFRAEPDLHAWADGQAAMEGISRSDIARRALATGSASTRRKALPKATTTRSDRDCSCFLRGQWSGPDVRHGDFQIFGANS